MNNNTKRVAIVTGSSRGIGQACVKQLASDGLSVVVTYVHNAAKAEQIAQEINNSNGDAIAIRVDVSNEDSVKALFTQTIEQLGGVDVVVNAAGIMKLSPIAELDLTVLDQIYQTNVRGTFAVNKYAAQYLRDGGAIINFSTSVTKLALPTYGAYAASKGAVEALSLILAKELRGRDITVNAIAPGPTATELFFDGKDEATIERLANMNPLQRLGTPEDIAGVVSMLAGSVRWINGQVIYANGGMI